MFDINKCYECFQSEPNSAYFWSGLGSSGADIAAKVAQENNGTTLEMLMEKNKDTLISAGFDYDPDLGGFYFSFANADDWKSISQAFAEQSSGDVHVVLGDNVRENSIWNTKELPALKENSGVDSVIAVNPSTGKEDSILYVNPFNTSSQNDTYAPSDVQFNAMKREPNLDVLLNTPKVTQDSLSAAQANVAASSAADTAQSAASSLKGGLGV